jgi:uncharacterized protein YndB with AHSA1/START domain
MTAIKDSIAVASDRELVIQRIFDARPETVFEVWTKVEHVVNWFGPSGFTAPFCEIDFRVGGSYRICMRAPDGDDHWVWGEYKEIVEPERIVFTWNRGEDLRAKLWSSTVVEVTFESKGVDATLFTLRQGLFEAAQYCDEHSFGWNQCLDRLGDYVSNV